MKKTTVLLSSVLSATLVLSACGHDDSNPKLSNSSNQNKKSKEGKDSDKDKKTQDSKDNREKGKRLTSNSTPKKKKEDDEIRKKHNKNDKRVDNDSKNLPDKLKTSNGQRYTDDTGYTSVTNNEKTGKKEDITDYLRDRKVDNVDDSAPVRIYDQFEKQFKKAYPKVEEIAQNSKIDPNEKMKKRKNIIKDYFYDEEDGFDRLHQFANNHFKPDYSTLDITYSDQKNTYIWQMSFKNKDGKKVGSFVGYYYDYVDAISLIDGGLTNEGAINEYDNAQDYYHNKQK